MRKALLAGAVALGLGAAHAGDWEHDIGTTPWQTDVGVIKLARTSGLPLEQAIKILGVVPSCGMIADSKSCFFKYLDHSEISISFQYVHAGDRTFETSVGLLEQCISWGPAYDYRKDRLGT
jgi:hypothetical protein